MAHHGSAKDSIDRSLPVLTSSNSLENNESSLRVFIDDKIKEIDSLESDETFIVANLDEVVERHRCWHQHLPRVKPFYAVKSNNTPVLIRMLSALGTGFDCASKAEIQQVLSLGVAADRIIFAHTIKPRSHVKYAHTHGVQMMTFDSEGELSKILQCHPSAKLVLRLKVDDSTSMLQLGAKFGAELAAAGYLLRCARELGLEVIGVSFHVGACCGDSMAFMKAIADARHVFDIATLLGFQMNLLDIGGGFSARKNPHTRFDELSKVINWALEEFFPPDCGVQIIAEPGLYFAATPFTLAVKVIAKKSFMEEADEHNACEKRSSVRQMYYVNDGVHSCLHYLLVESMAASIHIHKTIASGEKKFRSVIWGPTCDSRDKIADDYWLPELHEGDWILIEEMGAYSLSLANEFNGFKRGHMYIVGTDEANQILQSEK
ncbi:ornithine decarboxylase-like [Genypterus blacodes]|uniref:ornithine decarboxylase-like n=1 Tax=Genypterus blacodes TaxID=154954 RepID=UPI003F778233